MNTPPTTPADLRAQAQAWAERNMTDEWVAEYQATYPHATADDAFWALYEGRLWELENDNITTTTEEEA